MNDALREVGQDSLLFADDPDVLFFGEAEANPAVYPGWRDHLAKLHPIYGKDPQFIEQVADVLNDPVFSTYTGDRRTCEWLVETSFRTSYITYLNRDPHGFIGQAKTVDTLKQVQKLSENEFLSRAGDYITVMEKDQDFFSLLTHNSQFFHDAGGANKWVDAFPKLYALSKKKHMYSARDMLPFTEMATHSVNSKWKEYIQSNEQNIRRLWQVIDGATENKLSLRWLTSSNDAETPLEINMSQLEKAVLLTYRGIPHGFIEQNADKVLHSDINWNEKGVRMFLDSEVQLELFRFDCMASAFYSKFPSELAYKRSGRMRESIRSLDGDDDYSIDYLDMKDNFRVTSDDRTIHSTLIKIARTIPLNKPYEGPHVLSGFENSRFGILKQCLASGNTQLQELVKKEIPELMEILIQHNKFEDISQLRSEKVIDRSVLHTVGFDQFRFFALHYSVDGLRDSLNKHLVGEINGVQKLRKIQQAFGLSIKECQPYAEIYARALLNSHESYYDTPAHFLMLCATGLVSKNFFKLPPSIKAAALWYATERYYKEGNETAPLQKLFPLLDSPQYTDVRVQSIVDFISSNKETFGHGFEQLLADVQKFKSEITQHIPLIEQEFKKQFSSGKFSVHRFEQIQKIYESLGMSDAISDLSSLLPLWVSTLIGNYKFTSISDLRKFMTDHEEFVSYISSSKAETVLMNKKNANRCRDIGLSLLEGELLLRNGMQLKGIHYAKAFSILKNMHPKWKEDKEGIYTNLIAAGKMFGAERMMKYISRPTISRHDALIHMKEIMRLARKARKQGVSYEQFYQQILLQIREDIANYPEGNSYLVLNSIAPILIKKDFNRVLASSKKYTLLPQIHKLLRKLKKPSDVFKDWKQLKRYADVVGFLSRKELMTKLIALKQDGTKKKHIRYVETLAFHPDSKVDAQSVMDFMFNTKTFLQTKDGNSNEKIHDGLKPSTYMDVDHLNFTAEELRDGLIEGAFDKAQRFKPHDMRFTVRVGFSHLPLHDQIRAALGSKTMPGAAKDIHALWNSFHKAFVIFRKNGQIPAGYTIQDYINQKNIHDSHDIPVEMQNALTTILHDSVFGLPDYGSFDGTELTFIASVHAKSDPIGVLAGNDTASCMPWGSGKTNIYLYNPTHGFFTLRLVQGNKLLTIATSVLTEDIDIGKTVDEIFTGLKEEADLLKLFPESILIESDPILSCDNIEVNKNYKAGAYSKIIPLLYSNFFASYMKKFAPQQHWVTGIVPVGKGNTDVEGLEKMDNTLVQEAPPAYTDKTHKETLVLLPSVGSLPGFTVTEAIELPTAIPDELKSIQYSDGHLIELTPSDALRASYLERKIYADNLELAFGLAIMERNLIGSQLANAVRTAPNLSVKHVSDSGELSGYVIAYEGALETGEKIIYINNMVASGPREAVRLINGLMEQYTKLYVDNGVLLPLHAEFREKTSYRLITKHLEKIGETSNLQFDVEEVDEMEIGDESLKHLIIRPRLKKREIQEEVAGLNALPSAATD